uniref:HDC06250 n=1 Tax=Drosophila melanogaster TaxID=7227 RepID=Q6IGH8_DROME|nr:TPA_inf: HDC06250 [Drosophila melanogaster]
MVKWSHGAMELWSYAPKGAYGIPIPTPYKWLGWNSGAVVQLAPGETKEPTPACSRLHRALFKFHNVDNFANRHLMQAPSSQAVVLWHQRGGVLGRGRGTTALCLVCGGGFCGQPANSRGTSIGGRIGGNCTGEYGVQCTPPHYCHWQLKVF